MLLKDKTVTYSGQPIEYLGEDILNGLAPEGYYFVDVRSRVRQTYLHIKTRLHGTPDAESVWLYIGTPTRAELSVSKPQRYNKYTHVPDAEISLGIHLPGGA